MTPTSHATLESVLAALPSLLTSRPPLLGGGRLVCVDGRSGSGKTWLTQALREVSDDVAVLRMEDFYAGWEGLAGTPERVGAELLGPMARGAGADLSRWDWLTGRWGPRVDVAPPEPGQVLVLEGVGAGARCCAAYASALVWCEAPEDVRRQRALDRDEDFGTGAAAQERWASWADQEDVLLAREATPTRADLVWRNAG